MSTSSNTHTRIDLISKFDATCFHLRKKKLLKIVDGSEAKPADVTQQAGWENKNLDASLILHAALGVDQKKHIISCKTSHEAYTILKSVFGAADLVTVVNLQDKFCIMKLKEGQSVAKHLEEFSYTSGRLELLGVTVKEDESKDELGPEYATKLQTFGPITTGKP